MKPLYQTITKHGVEWLYRPKTYCVGSYRGYQINVRYSPAEKKWRVMVSWGLGGGIGLTFRKQFHNTLDEARKFGISVVDLKLDNNETPYI